MKINCKQCNKEIQLPPSAIKKGRKCCSYNCGRLFLWSKPEYREHMSNAHVGNVPTNLEQLKSISQSVEGRKRQSEIGKKIGGWNKGKKMPKLSGENHYLWIEDRTKLKDDSKERGGQLHREWSRQVKNRDNWKCRISNGNCSGRVVAHHILRWSEFKELRYEINNGITLCSFHHPRKRVDENQLSPFFQNLLGVNLKLN